MDTTTTTGDPTREELIAFLEHAYPQVTCGETCHTEAEADDDAHDGCGCRMDIEAAAWFLAAHWHGGQWSNLYSALSLSPFDPGPMMRDEDVTDDASGEWTTAHELYVEGDKWIREGCPDGPWTTDDE